MNNENLAKYNALYLLLTLTTEELKEITSFSVTDNEDGSKKISSSFRKNCDSFITIENTIKSENDFIKLFNELNKN